MHISSIYTIFASIRTILFGRNCIVCQSHSTQLLCHRCRLPPSIKSDSETRCVKCFEKIISGQLCLYCDLAAVRFNRFRFLYNYGENVRDFCLTLKYKPSLKLINEISKIMSSEIGQLFNQSTWDYLIPMPSSKVNFKKRGFNHVELLAKSIKNNSDFRFNILDALKINSKRAPQASLSKRKRISGFRKRYKIKKRHLALLHNKKILLIDDIATTGASLHAALYSLRHSGVKSIDILTICRSQSWYKFRKNLK